MQRDRAAAGRDHAAARANQRDAAVDGAQADRAAVGVVELGDALHIDAAAEFAGAEPGRVTRPELFEHDRTAAGVDHIDALGFERIQRDAAGGLDNEVERAQRFVAQGIDDAVDLLHAAQCRPQRDRGGFDFIRHRDEVDGIEREAVAAAQAQHTTGFAEVGDADRAAQDLGAVAEGQAVEIGTRADRHRAGAVHRMAVNAARVADDDLRKTVGKGAHLVHIEVERATRADTRRRGDRNRVGQRRRAQGQQAAATQLLFAHREVDLVGLEEDVAGHAGHTRFCAFERHPAAQRDLRRATDDQVAAVAQRDLAVESDDAGGVDDEVAIDRDRLVEDDIGGLQHTQQVQRVGAFVTTADDAADAHIAVACIQRQGVGRAGAVTAEVVHIRAAERDAAVERGDGAAADDAHRVVDRDMPGRSRGVGAQRGRVTRAEDRQRWRFEVGADEHLAACAVGIKNEVVFHDHGGAGGAGHAHVVRRTIAADHDLAEAVAHLREFVAGQQHRAATKTDQVAEHDRAGRVDGAEAQRRTRAAHRGADVNVVGGDVDIVAVGIERLVQRLFAGQADDIGRAATRAVDTGATGAADSHRTGGHDRDVFALAARRDDAGGIDENGQRAVAETTLRLADFIQRGECDTATDRLHITAADGAQHIVVGKAVDQHLFVAEVLGDYAAADRVDHKAAVGQQPVELGVEDRATASEGRVPLRCQCVDQDRAPHRTQRDVAARCRAAAVGLDAGGEHEVLAQAGRNVATALRGQRHRATAAVDIAGQREAAAPGVQAHRAAGRRDTRAAIGRCRDGDVAGAGADLHRTAGGLRDAVDEQVVDLFDRDFATAGIDQADRFDTDFDRVRCGADAGARRDAQQRVGRDDIGVAFATVDDTAGGDDQLAAGVGAQLAQADRAASGDDDVAAVGVDIGFRAHLERAGAGRQRDVAAQRADIRTRPELQTRGRADRDRAIDAVDLACDFQRAAGAGQRDRAGAEHLDRRGDQHRTASTHVHRRAGAAVEPVDKQTAGFGDRDAIARVDVEFGRRQLGADRAVQCRQADAR